MKKAAMVVNDTKIGWNYVMVVCAVLSSKVFESTNRKEENSFVSFVHFQRDVGVQAIEQLLEKRRNHFDYILLETTGVADPLPIVNMFWLDDELHSDLILDGKQTPVD